MTQVIHPTTRVPTVGLLDRFWSHVEKSEGCWRWTASLGSTGYGQFRVRPRTWKAHRWIYEQLNGPLPDGQQLDHLCRNRWCVRPDHLEPVTSAENTRRGMSPSSVARRRGTCKFGHPLTPIPSKPEWQRCRQCVRDREAGRREAYT